MKLMKFVKYVHINVLNVHQNLYVPFVLEIENKFQTVTVLLENTMMEQLNVKLVHAIIILVSML
jgi:hypothetical protein